MKIAVVTGGTRGIGRAVCAALGDARRRVYALGRTQPTQPLPLHTRFVACDVSSHASVQSAFQAIGAEAGRIDVLVNNAGIAGTDRLDDLEDRGWEQIIETNLDGAYRCTKAALPFFARSGGRVVFVSSVLGLRGAPDQIAYTAAKHGTIGLARAFALALASRGITSNAVCPGWVDTGMARQRFADLGIDEGAARAAVPTGAIATPEEIAAAVAYLVGEAARNITGQFLVIDGGSSA